MITQAENLNKYAPRHRYKCPYCAKRFKAIPQRTEHSPYPVCPRCGVPVSEEHQVRAFDRTRKVLRVLCWPALLPVKLVILSALGVKASTLGVVHAAVHQCVADRRRSAELFGERQAQGGRVARMQHPLRFRGLQRHPLPHAVRDENQPAPGGKTSRRDTGRMTRVSRKPDSVGGSLRGDHSSGVAVSGTPRCDRPWGMSEAGHTSPPLFGLAPGGVYRAGPVTGTAGALLPHRFTLARSASCDVPVGGLLSVALSVGSRPLGVTQHPALWSPDFPRTTASAPA